MTTADEFMNVKQAGGSVVDSSGSKIGKVELILFSDETSEPTWVSVKTGMFGGGTSFIPLDGASVSGDDIWVAASKSQVKDAPRLGTEEGHLSKEEEQELYRHYGIQRGGVAPSDQATVGGEQHDRDPEPFGQDDSAHTARLGKHVVTENVTQTVPVSHEEVHVEREPVSDADREALSGAELTSEEHEMVLSEERLVITKETVPVERVRMSKTTVTEDQEVNEDVRKERLDP